jgi:hypothetical protein
LQVNVRAHSATTAEKKSTNSWTSLMTSKVLRETYGERFLLSREFSFLLNQFVASVQASRTKLIFRNRRKLKLTCRIFSFY